MLFLYEFGVKSECFVFSLSKWIKIQEFCDEIKPEVKLHFTDKHMFCQLQGAFPSSENFIRDIVHFQHFCLLVHHEKPL